MEQHCSPSALHNWNGDLYTADLILSLRKIDDQSRLIHVEGMILVPGNMIDALEQGTPEGKMFYDLDPETVGKVLDDILEKQRKSASIPKKMMNVFMELCGKVLYG